MSSRAARTFGQGEIRCFTGLRGCAALLVMLYHFALNMPAGTVPMAAFLHNGYLWVDLFFVLSGFVMAYSQAALFEQGYRCRAHLAFLMSRLARIYPLYALVCLESAALLLWRNDHIEVASFVRTFLLNVTLLQGWGMAPSLEGAAWSISTEWGAYLAFPLLLTATVSSSRRVAGTAALLALTALAYLATAAGPFTYPDQGRSGPLDLYSAATGAPLVRCVAEFTLGLLAFRGARHIVSRGRSRTGTLAAATLLALGVALSVAGLDLLVVGLFAVLLVVLAPQTGIVARALGTGGPYRLGQWSYSIYLIHDKFSHPTVALQQVLAAHIPFAAPVAIVAMGGAVIGCSALTFRFVERPLRIRLLGLVRRLPALDASSSLQDRRVEESSVAHANVAG